MMRFLVGANILQIGVFAWKFNRLPEQIPLFYSAPWGESQIADLWYILLLPLFMNGIFALNRYLENKLFPDDVTFHRLFLVVHILTIVGFTGICLKILFLIA